MGFLQLEIMKENVWKLPCDSGVLYSDIINKYYGWVYGLVLSIDVLTNAKFPEKHTLHWTSYDGDRTGVISNKNVSPKGNV